VVVESTPRTGNKSTNESHEIPLVCSAHTYTLHWSSLVSKTVFGFIVGRLVCGQIDSGLVGGCGKEIQAEAVEIVGRLLKARDSKRNIARIKRSREAKAEAKKQAKKVLSPKANKKEETQLPTRDQPHSPQAKNTASVATVKRRLPTKTSPEPKKQKPLDEKCSEPEANELPTVKSTETKNNAAPKKQEFVATWDFPSGRAYLWHKGTKLFSTGDPVPKDDSLGGKSSVVAFFDVDDAKNIAVHGGGQFVVPIWVADLLRG
jgi:hypothetical protein